MARALVTYLIDTVKKGPESTMANIDADYVKGIVLFRAEAPILSGDPDNLVEVKGPRPIAIRMVQRDSETGAYAALDAGRNMSEFKASHLGRPHGGGQQRGHYLEFKVVEPSHTYRSG